MSRLLTKKFLLTVAVLTIATLALWHGKIDGGTWVYAVAVGLAGNHSEDIVKAWRK